MNRGLPIILAVDFDETLVHSHPFPKIKGFRRGARKYISKLYNEGYYIIIWTCRTDKDECLDETDAWYFLIREGVKYNKINQNHPALCKRFNNDCRKVAVDMVIDDKGLWPFGIPSWFCLYWIIKFKTLFLKENRKILSHCKPEHFYE